MIALAALLVAAPPIAPGIHRCGVQWSSYSELCTVAVEGDNVTIVSSGPSAKFNGKLVAIDDNNFSLEGELELVDVPVGYTTLTVCDEKAPFRFRHTGKRKFFRHTQTCPDMTTTYFDIFIDTFDASKIEMTKKLSAMKDKLVLDSRGTVCSPVSPETIKDANDPTCARWADSGYGTPYYDCTVAGGTAHLYVFDKAKACSDIANKRANEQKP